MKKLRVIAMSALIAVCTSVNAQESFSSVYAQYNFVNEKFSYDGYSHSESMGAVTLGYNYHINVSPDYPLYVELGLAAQYFFDSKTIEGIKEKFNMFSAKIPVNVMYGIEVSDNVSIEPFAGVFARFNIVGNVKEDGESWNIFDKDDYGDDTAKRFQFGLQAGARVRFNQQFYIGASYSQDLSKIWDHTTYNSIDVTLGFCF